MTFKFNNVYINETATITGPYESNGPLGKYFDLCHSDLYFGENDWEEAEEHLINEAINTLARKSKVDLNSVDAFIGGDLLNQIVASNYAMMKVNKSFIGIYAACSTSTLGLILGSSLIDGGFVNKVITFTSSHNTAAEKQYRYPVEYGGPKPKTTTFTSTGGVAALLSKETGNIKIESGTIGSVVDSGVKDVFNMGAVMAKAAADTIYKHLQDTGRDISYYDLVLTGDLGVYGKEILKEYMLSEYNIKLKNYNDTGVMLYDIENQPVYAGASGPACAPLVTYSYIFDKMKKGKYKKVLLAATGALMSPTMVNHKLSIPATCHAVSLEVIS